MIETKNITYSYDNKVILTFPDLKCSVNEAVLVLGSSGVGKTTLLHLLSGLLSLQSGSVKINGQNLEILSNTQRDRFRGQHIGLVLQQSYFVASISVIENIVLASWVVTKVKDYAKAETLLQRLQIETLKDKYPYELSVGQQQRVAIARALINNPKVVLADEPTSALDDENTEKVIQLLQAVCQENTSALIIVTHDTRLKKVIPNQINLQ